MSSAMDNTERHLRVAKLEIAADPPLKATRGDRAHSFRQLVAAGANERSCLIRGAPASLEDQGHKVATREG